MGRYEGGIESTTGRVYMSDIVQYAKSLVCRETRKELIMSLEELSKQGIASGELQEADDNLEEVFCNGMYSRQITLKAGVAAVGEIHKQDHINILSSGRVVVVTEEGTQELVAPHRWVGTAGTKRATLVIEDAVWTTFHATQHTTSEEVRRDFVAKTFADVPLIEERYGMGSDSNCSNVSCNDVSTEEPSR